MAYLVQKLTIFAIIVELLTAIPQALRIIPNPDASWDAYQAKICPTGYVELQHYCVKCNPPKVFDAIDQRCKKYPFAHTHQTKATVPCTLPRKLNANNICECPPDQIGTKRVFSQRDNTCVCPSDFPLWDGKYCVVCLGRTQQLCQDGFVRDNSSRICIPQL